MAWCPCCQVNHAHGETVEGRCVYCWKALAESSLQIIRDNARGLGLRRLSSRVDKMKEDSQNGNQSQV